MAPGQRLHRILLTALLPALTVAVGGCALQQLRPETTTPPDASARPAAPAADPARRTGGLPRDATARPREARGAAAATGPAADGDLWTRIRAGLAIEAADRPRIAREREWFLAHPDYLDRVAERAQRYLHYVVEEADRRGLPMELTLLPVIESAYQPFAYSRSHAAGIWQFVPSTGRLYGLKQDWWYDGRRDIVTSTRAAFDYLERLHADFDGDWLLAVAAYNFGEGNVQKAVERNLSHGGPGDFWSLRVPAETRNYVPRLLALASLVAEPERYGISLEAIPDEPYFSKIDLGQQIDLELAADLAGISMDELRLLNPGFNRWATDPDGPHHLLLPVDRAERFRSGLAQVPASRRVVWDRHRIRRGETLGGIARRYHTTVAVLRDINDLRGTLIRAGHDLIVPAPGQALALYDGRPAEGADDAAAAAARPAVHVVRRGDTLWDISRRYGVPVEKLTAWNDLSASDLLHLGQRLRVRGAAGRAGGLRDAVARTAEARRIGYTVRTGDSLWAISRRFSVSLRSLLRWNDLTGSEVLRPGQRLHIYLAPRPAAEQS